MKKHFLSNIYIYIFLLIFFIFYFLFFIEDKKPTLESKINNMTESNLLNKNKILNPVFNSKSLNANPYQISAKSGIQIDNNLELQEIKASFTNEKGELINLEADVGIYNELNQSIELIGNVIVYNKELSKSFADKAYVNIETKQIDLQNNILSIRNSSEISSKTLLINEYDGVIIYTGNVTAIIKVGVDK